MGQSHASQRVQDYLNQFDLDLEVKKFPASTRTAQDAADAIGCTIGQIVKSLIFRSDEKPLLFLVSGDNRLDVSKVSRDLDISIEKANAQFVRDKSGYAIGGVPPVAHSEKMEVYIDRDLLSFEEVWAAAGTPHTVFRLNSNNLTRITDGQIIDVK